MHNNLAKFLLLYSCFLAPAYALSEIERDILASKPSNFPQVSCEKLWEKALYPFVMIIQKMQSPQKGVISAIQSTSGALVVRGVIKNGTS